MSNMRDDEDKSFSPIGETVDIIALAPELALEDDPQAAYAVIAESLRNYE